MGKDLLWEKLILIVSTVLLRTSLRMPKGGYQINLMWPIKDDLVTIVYRLEGPAMMILKTDCIKNHSGGVM